MKRFLRVMTVVVVFGVFAGALHSLAGAQTITQGYGANEPIQRATIVSLAGDDLTKVEPASPENQDRLHGVVVNQNDAPFTLSTEEERTFVATTGRFEAFVSNESGAIELGDLITVSHVAGIGMKAGEEDPFMIGTAISEFDGVSGVLSTTSVDISGVSTVVAIGRIQVDLGVGGNPFLKSTEANLPSFLKRLAENIAQKPVSALRVYIGLVLFGVAALLSGVLLYTGVRTGIISIGRNPLSKKSVVRSVLQVSLTSIIILLVGVFAVYLILRI